MKGWKTGTLGSLCNIEIGGTPSRNNPTYWDPDKQSGNKWVSIKDLNKRVITATAEQISDLGVRKSNVKIQKAGTILLSFKLTIGRVAFAGVDLYTNEAIAGLSTEKLDTTFLFYGLQQWNLLQDVDQAIKGATLNKDKLKRIRFEYPESREEQAKIATVLSNIDRAIEQTEAIIAKQARIKAGLMQDLLTRGIDENGNIRSEATHQFKDSVLGRIPVEWETKTCRMVSHEIVVGIVIRPTQYYKPSGVPVLRSANVRENDLDASDLVFMSEEDNRRLKKSSVSKGDLVTVRTGYPGTTCVIPDAFDGANCVDIIISRPKISEILPNFLSIWINSHFGKRQIIQGQGGLAQQHFNVAALKALLISVPKTPEQEKIQTVLLKHRASIRRAQCDLEKLKLIKIGLMQDLLTGKVPVTLLLKKNKEQLAGIS